MNPQPAIHYLTGDATSPTGAGPKIIVHICNDVGAWGAGFVLALSNRWPTPEAQFRSWARRQQGQPPYELGAVQFVAVTADVTVSNLVGQRDMRVISGIPPIRYDAVRIGLTKIATHAIATNASIHMPRIGCGLAGGNWQRIEPIIADTLIASGMDVYVYDLPR
jgi:O-acetyl-ADP-ribose deacetylase (regulator of RNase III)